mmetsp:Transcript_89823/g.254438  ORF Transcript_89823/g.254438 Transcript_89823/m.254438 type:complete len:237 (+) Transcript_89823:391-1101(+)
MPGSALQDGGERQLSLGDSEALSQLLGDAVDEDHSQRAPLHHKLRADVQLLREPCGVLESDETSIHEKTSIAVLCKAGESLRVYHLESRGDFQGIHQRVEKPLCQLMEGHEIRAGSSIDPEPRMRPDVAPQDAAWLQGPNAVEALGAHPPQVLEPDLVALRAGQEVVDEVPRPRHLLAEEVGMGLQGRAQGLEQARAAREPHQGVRSRHLEAFAEALLRHLLQGKGVHARLHGGIG